jgi:hypothetical protein
VAKRAAGNKITRWRSRRLRGIIAPVAGGCVLVGTTHADFYCLLIRQLELRAAHGVPAIQSVLVFFVSS